MRWPIVWGVAQAEARLVRRLVRYWVFVVLAAGLGMLGYLYYAALHGFFSSFSASIGSISPKFLVAAIGSWYLLVFMIGLVLLAFDVRARDERERIVEVLDTRPCSNLELLAGRFLGILLPSWLPVVATGLLMQLVGWLGQTLHWRIGEPIEAWSLLGFMTFMAIPTFTFLLGLVFLVAVLVRNRFLTALIVLGLLAVNVWLTLTSSLYVVPAIDLTGVFTFNYASELVPTLLNRGGLVQRLSVLVAGLALLALASAAHPRLDGGSRKRWASAGVVGLVLAALGLGSIAYGVHRDRQQMATWLAAHEARREEPAPDLESLVGALTIEPGRRLQLELEVAFTAPAEGLETALFSFNPGLGVEAVTDATGSALTFTHQDGLLAITLDSPLAAGARGTLSLRAAGRPDTAFAYLDSAEQPLDRSALNGNLLILGLEAAIFDRRYAALMPGIRWLPAAGVEVGREEDFFTLDLEVTVPEGWLVAGPGRRQTAAAGAAGQAVYRFAPPAPLPAAALMAARFERRGATVEGVELEILLHPDHTRNLEVFADAGEEIRGWIGTRLREAAALDLPYPYGALTMVEVPAALRGYGGGWRMDSTLAPPALLLVRESSFPTVRFDNRFRNTERFEDREGGVAAAKREALQAFFVNDYNGGNVFLGAARNFFAYQTAARGPGALALDFVTQDLTNRLITDQEGYFSPYIFGKDLNAAVGATVANFIGGRSQGMTIFEAVRQAVAEKPSVWEAVTSQALVDLDPHADPALTINVLTLKAGALARWLLDGLGRETSGALLATLRQRHTGTTYDRADFEAAATAVGADLEALAGDWLERAALPGFVTSSVHLYRLPDGEGGTPRYQVALDVRNQEPVPGLVRLRYEPGGESEAGQGAESARQGEAVSVPAQESVELGLVLPAPPKDLWVAPYLSLNRRDFRVELPAVDEEHIVSAEPLVGARPSSWRPAIRGDVIVDDLDPGFAIEQEESSGGFRLGGTGQVGELDQGLPQLAGIQPAAVWSRQLRPRAWGTYRHTVATVRAGQGKSRAVFSAQLPHAGRWRLALHWTPPSLDDTVATALWRRGTYHLLLDDGTEQQELSFDAAAAEEGWNDLGSYDLGAGEVRLVLLDRTNGMAVVADAIRWHPLDGTAPAEADEAAAAADQEVEAEQGEAGDEED